MRDNRKEEKECGFWVVRAKKTAQNGSIWVELGQERGRGSPNEKGEGKR